MIKFSKNKKFARKIIDLAEVRLQKDLAEIDMPNAEIEFDSDRDLKNFRVKLKIVDEESLWFGGTFVFEFCVKERFPFEPPRVRLLTKVLHPCIDYDGRINLGIFFSGWKPVFTIFTCIFELNAIFIWPSADDCMNQFAGNLMRNNYSEFVQAVRSSLLGQTIDGQEFKKLL